MLAQNMLIELHHFNACYAETFLFKTVDNVAAEGALYR